MESKIEDFNWNLRCFLDALNSFENDVGLGDNMTLDLLAKAQETVDKLSKKLQPIRSKNGNEMIMCSIDSKHFETRRAIYCCRCEKSFPATRRDYLLHSADSEHHMKLIEYANIEKTGQTNESSKKSLICDANNNNNDKSIKMPSQAAVNNNKPNSFMAIDTSQIESSLSIEKIHRANAKTGDSPKKQQTNMLPNRNVCQLSNNVTATLAAASPQNLFKPKEKETPKAIPMDIPNVFDDNIYEFLEKRKKQHTPKPVEPVKNVWQPRSASKAVPLTSTNTFENWRERTNDPIPPGDVNKPNSTVPIRSQMNTVNGVESLYSQFPHLDRNKVKNPYEPTPMTISAPSTNKNSIASQPPRKSDGLDKLAEMLNRENEAKTQQTPSLFGSLFSFDQQINKEKPGPISPPNSFQATTPNMVRAGMHPYNPLFYDPSFHGPRPDMMFQHFPNNMPPGYGAFLGPCPSPWSHPANGSPLVQQYPNQPKSNPHPNSSKLAVTKKNNLSNSMTSLPATFNGQIKKQQQEQKNGPDEHRGRASSVIDMDRGKKSNGADAKRNETKRKSSPSEITEFFAKDLSARISFISKSNSTFGKNKTADLLMKQVINLLNKKFNNKVKCHLIGSHAYETAIDNNTPVDIYLDLLDSFHKDKSGAMLVNAMNDVQKILGENDEWSDVKCSEQTRFGVLSAINTKNKLKCHFRFGTGVVVRNSDVIKSLFEAQPVCRQLVICVRLLMQEMQSGDRYWLNKFNGYIVTLMVIFYFQVNKKLPSVCSLQAAMADRELCGENHVAFSKPKNVTICKDRLRVFLLGFFEFYKNFQYDRKIISPFQGHEISHDVRNSDERGSSNTVNRFRKLITSGPQKWTSNTLCIQDIFEHKNNSGYTVKSDDIKAFKYFCTKALNALQANGDSVKY